LRGSVARGDLKDTLAPHRREPKDLESQWETYLQSEEFCAFRAAVEALTVLPPVGQLAERRADFELLLYLLHHLGEAIGVKHVSKHYRAHYSPDVQLSGYLYSTLLTAFTLLPSYVLNGQEFYVSDTVLDQCESLQVVFQETCMELRRQFDNLQPYSREQIRHDVRRSLVYFDRSWWRFELPALEEIEAIHRQACRPLIAAIEAERAMTELESRSCASSRACPPERRRARAEVLRARLMEQVCELNRLANVDGRGRSDMDIACVVEAERIVVKPMCVHPPEEEEGRLPTLPAAPHSCRNCASPVLLRIARALLRSLRRLRGILQKYDRCLYQLNSHLANNQDLVRALELLEGAWETASRYLVQPGPRRLALSAYSIVKGIRDPNFEASLCALDPGFLVATLPRTLLLHEMRRCGAGGKLAQKPPPPPGKLVKAAERTSRDHGRTQLPRPLDAASPPLSAFQLSPLARAFLPPACAQEYGSTAAAVAALPVKRLVRLRALLAAAPPTPERSCGATTLKAPSRLATASRTSTSGGIPRTVCPPRMALPNGSGSAESPSISKARVATATPEPPVPLENLGDAESESDGEEALALGISLRLASIGGGDDEVAGAGRAPVALAEEVSGAVDIGDVELRPLAASVSTLALELQRARPSEWNELIQVVLQGVMLARTHADAVPSAGVDVLH